MIINCHFKGLYKITVTKQNPTFLNYSFLIDSCMSFFSVLIKELVNFEKLIRFHQQAFMIYKNGEHLKILKEVFRQKLIVSNVILTFLDHPKPKIFFVGQPWWLWKSAPLFQNLWIRPMRSVKALCMVQRES